MCVGKNMQLLMRLYGFMLITSISTLIKIDGIAIP